MMRPLLLAFAFLLLQALPAQAQDFWLGSTSTTWSDGSNWLSGTAPTDSTDVTIGTSATQPEIASGIASCRNLDIQAGATVTIAGTGSLETHGAVSLLTSGGVTGIIALDSATSSMSVKGAWTQDLASAVTSNGGRVSFEGGATLGGLAVAIPFVRLGTGTATLLTDVSVVDLDATGGISAGSGFAWEFSDAAGALATGVQPVHLVRILGGLTTVGTSVVDELELTAGELLIDANSDVFFGTRLELLGGTVGFQNLSTSVLRIGGDLICGSAVTWGSGYVDMDGAATTISGPMGTRGYMNRCRLKSGVVTLLTVVEIDSWLGSVGGTSAGEWFDVTGSFAFLSGGGTLHRVRVSAGTVNAFNSGAEEFELLGGTFNVVGGQTFNVGTSGNLVGGNLNWNSSTTSKFRCQGDLIAGPGVTYGSGFVDMDGTTTIVGPAMGSARIGRLRLFSGVCTLLAEVKIDFELNTAGGSASGFWFEMVGTNSAVSSTSGSVHSLKVTGGKCTSDNATVEALEISGGILEVPSGKIMTVTGDAQLLGGQVEFSTSGFAQAAWIDVLGNVMQAGTTAAVTMSSKGSVRCAGVWTADAGIDLGDSFVEFTSGSSMTGAVPDFKNVRIADGASPVSLLVPMRVSGRLESEGGTSQGAYFEMTGIEAVLATTEDSLHEVRILSGVTTAETATFNALVLDGGELSVPSGKTLTIESTLTLTSGTLSLDPTDSGADALIVVEGSVTQMGVTAAALTGSGGAIQCNGIWFGNGPIDLDKSFVEMGPASTIIGSAVSFARLRLAEDASVSFNALVPVTRELVAESGSSTVGFFPIESTPGIGNTLAFSGDGQIGELNVIDGRVDATAANVTTLRLVGGTFAATGIEGETTVTNLSLEGGEVLVAEGATLLVTGAATLTSGTIGFEADLGDGAGLDALLIVQGNVHQLGATPSATTLANGALRCLGTWTGDAPMDLGLARVEIGSTLGVATIAGLVPEFGNLRIVDGTVDLQGPVRINGRLENLAGSSSGDWFEFQGAAAELATGAGSLHAVRVVAGSVRGFDSQVGLLEVTGGELILDSASTVTVNQDLELVAGSLAFDQLGGASSARLEVFGSAHQLGTSAGTVSHPDAVLSVFGDFIGDGPSVYGDAWIELRPGARLLGSAPVIEKLRIAGPKVFALFGPQPAPAKITVAMGVTVAFEITANARLLLETGGLILVMPSVTIDGELEVSAGTVLGLGAATTLTVAPSGRLALLGTSGSVASVGGFGGGGYGLVVNGELACRNFAFRDMGPGGVVLSGTASLGTEGVHAGLFDRGVGAGPGPLFDLQLAGGGTMVGIDFLGTGADKSVKRLAGMGLGEFVFQAYGGPYGGEPFEQDPSQVPPGDPDGLVLWQILPDSDLLILDISSDTETVLGWPLALDFSVVNEGAITATAPWTDRVYLTSNTVIGDADDVLLAEYVHTGDEASGELYQVVDSPILPMVTEGTWYVALVTDVLDDVDEAGNEGNNTMLSAPVQIFATARPDLLAGDLTGPAVATDGETISVTWTVFNDGLGPATGTWQDRIYLSSDLAFGGDDLAGSFPIAVGEQRGGFTEDTSYTETQEVTLPLGIAGDFHFVLRTDAIDDVSEETKENNNVQVLPGVLTVTQPDLPDLVGSFEPVTSPLGALYTNSTVDLQWLVTNADTNANGLGTANGPVQTRFWYSIDNILDPLVDTLIFADLHEGIVAPDGTYGGTKVIDLPALPGTWWLFGETDDQSSINEDNEANNTWEAILNVAVPSWTGSVATTFIEGLSSTGVGTQLISLTGQSTVIGSGALAPNADLTIRVRQGSTRRVFPVTTDAIGGYILVFEPLVGEAGLFEIFCDHPAVEENPLLPEVSLTLHGLGATPTTFSKVMVTGEIVPVSIGLSNQGELPLIGISAVLSAVPAHLSVSNLVMPSGLAGGAADVLTFDLTALADSPVPGAPDSFNLDLSIDIAGTSTLARSLVGSVWVTPFSAQLAAPDLPSAIALATDQATGLTFHLVNQGAAPATGVSVAIDSAADHGFTCFASTPFVLVSPASLGTLAAGAACPVELSFLPGDCAELTAGTNLNNYAITVTSDQGVSVFTVDLSVTATPQTSLTVRVQDVATWWQSSGTFVGGSGSLLAGAQVTLTDSSGVETLLPTDLLGFATFNSLEPGTYGIAIRGPLDGANHGQWTAPVSVQAGQAITVEAYLSAVDQTYAISGVDTFGGVPGELDFTSSGASSGIGQAAHLEIDGQLMDLEMNVGETKQFDLVITNTGGAEASGIELFVPDLPDYDVALEFAFLGNLAKGESTSAAVVVTRLGTGDACDLGKGWGLRSYVFSEQALWRWTPLFLAAPDSAGCGSFVTGGAPPPNLPAPIAGPPMGPVLPGGPAVPPIFGTSANNGANPSAPLAPSAPNFLIPFGA
jgi:hypothetical protein